MALSVYILHVLAFNWWSSFFQCLQSQNQSYRFLQIWVQSDSTKRPFVIPVGSSDLDLEQWSQGVDHFLQQSFRYPNVSFLYSFITDEKTFYQHNDLFLKWTEKYPKKIEFVFYSDLLAPLPQLTNAPNQCENGIAAACSDLLRLISLHNPLYDYNVYMDIDTFIHCRKFALNPLLPSSPFAHSSKHFLGLSLSTPGLAHSSYTYVGNTIDQSTLHINNDLLIDFKTPQWLWNFVQSLGFQRLEPAANFFDLLAERPLLTTYEQYLLHLDTKVQFALEHPHQNINQVPLVINTVGPGLWKDLYLRGLSHRYPLPVIPSNGGWMNHICSVYGNTSASDLALFLSEDPCSIQNMLALNFLAHDYYYFEARNSPWIPFLKETIHQKLKTISLENFEIGKNLFQSPYFWIEEIAHG